MIRLEHKGRVYYADLVSSDKYMGALDPDQEIEAREAAAEEAWRTGLVFNSDDRKFGAVEDPSDELLATAWDVVSTWYHTAYSDIGGHYVRFSRRFSDPRQVWVEEGGCWARECNMRWLHVWERGDRSGEL